MHVENQDRIEIFVGILIYFLKNHSYLVFTYTIINNAEKKRLEKVIHALHKMYYMKLYKLLIALIGTIFK